MTMDDSYDLQRFVTAQAEIYEDVCSELRAGQKTSHWMWFIFPQIQGLGRSGKSMKYAISSRSEAKAYSEHSILGPRLVECTRLVILIAGRSITDIFGWPDDMKFRSSMTLFGNCAAHNQVFKDALQKYFDGYQDPQTVKRLEP